MPYITEECMYARPPTISQLEHVIFIFTYIVALEIDDAREKVQATTTTHISPYQRRGKELFTRITLLFMTSNVIKKSTDVFIYCYVST